MGNEWSDSNQGDSQDRPYSGEIDLSIYSSNAIVGFSLFFSPIFGAVLMMYNLRDIGKYREGNIVFLLSVAYCVLLVWGISSVGDLPGTMAYPLNIVVAIILGRPVFKKYFPDGTQYQKKSILKPLIIGISIVAFLLLLNIFGS